MDYQQEQPQQYQRRIQYPSWMSRPLRVIPVVVAINVVVFLLFNLASPGSALEAFLFNNFLVSSAHVKAGYVWTLITNAFSHIDAFHILFNMIVIYSFGSVLERFLGPGRFSALYFAAAILGSAGHCLTASLLLGNSELPALGASGAASGIIMVFALLFPKQRILIMGIIPIPAMVGVLGFVAYDIWGLVSQTRGGLSNIGHGAHLAGTATGLFFYYAYIKPKLQRIEVREEPMDV